MKRDLRGRRILVTGASSGMGRAVAEQAARAGARVVLAARSADKLDELACQLTAEGAEVFSVPTDLAEAAQRARLIEQAAARLDGLDALLNIAGVSGFGHFATSSEALLRQIMEVNFFAPAELSRLAIPHLVRGHQPAILNLSSMCGRRALPAWPEYSASKYALVGLSEALRAELVRYSIDVLVVLPGLTRSEWSEHLLRNEGRMNIDWSSGMDPAEVARQILDALCSNRSETVIGSDARWMLRVNRFFPRLVDRLIARRVRQLYAS